MASDGGDTVTVRRDPLVCIELRGEGEAEVAALARTTARCSVHVKERFPKCPATTSWQGRCARANRSGLFEG